jgi:hypothetical protein
LGAVLIVETPPVFQSVTQTNGTLTFTWRAMSGRTYQVQSTTNLASTIWTNLGGAFTASNSSLNASYGLGSPFQQFYRILLLP